MSDGTPTATAPETAVYVRPEALLRHARSAFGETGCSVCGSGQPSVPEIADFLGIRYLTLWRILGSPKGTRQNPGKPRERAKASDTVVRTITERLPDIDFDDLFERVAPESLRRSA